MTITIPILKLPAGGHGVAEAGSEKRRDGAAVSQDGLQCSGEESG